MIESVFIEILQKGIASQIVVEEALPCKGKPAQKKLGSRSVWLVKVVLNNNEVIALESARGGHREWASLDNLTKWLRVYGINKYSVKLLAIDQLLQQNIAFSNLS